VWLARRARALTFWFTARFEKQKTIAAKSPCPERPLRGARVLIVDDNAVNRTVAKQYVVSWGMEAECAVGGAEALELLGQQSEHQCYDLALLDMHMPEIDGIALAKQIKANPRWAGMKLVLLTSVGASGICKSLPASLFHVCLTKPITKAHLFECLTKTISDRRGSPSLSSPRVPLSAQAPSLRAASYPGAKPMRLLLAEDSAVNQRVALMQLQKFGYRADTVAS